MCAKLLSALGLSDAPVAKTAFCASTRKLLVQVTRVATVLAAKADTNALLALEWPSSLDVRGVIVTAECADSNEQAQHDDSRVVSRYFAPWNGIAEDPVTGSALSLRRTMHRHSATHSVLDRRRGAAARSFSRSTTRLTDASTLADTRAVFSLDLWTYLALVSEAVK